MRILIVADNYYPHIGGVEALARSLAEGLARSHSVTVITRRLPGTAARETLGGVSVQRVRCPSRLFFPLAALPAVLKEASRADVVHALTPNGSAAAWLAARWRGKKCLLTVHEVWKGRLKEVTRMGAAHRFLYALFERLVYALPFDAYACVSSSTARELLRAGFAPGEKVSVVYNGFDAAKFASSGRKADVRKRLGLQKSFVCLTYGRTGPSKGIEYAVRAIPLIRIPNLKYVLVLADDYSSNHQRVLRLVRELGVEDRVVVQSPVPYSDLPDFIRAADCVVIPSLAEGFGYAVVEACSLGRPVVASNTTSIPEVIYGRHLLVEPGNPAAIAEGVEAIRKKKWRHSPKKDFSVERNREGYLRIYRSLAGRR